MVRGKFKFEQRSEYAGSEGVDVTFRAVCADDIPENVRFHRWTPSGELKMRVNNPAAVAQFELGKYYYLDFTPAEA